MFQITLTMMILSHHIKRKLTSLPITYIEDLTQIPKLLTKPNLGNFTLFLHSISKINKWL